MLRRFLFRARESRGTNTHIYCCMRQLYVSPKKSRTFSRSCCDRDLWHRLVLCSLGHRRPANKPLQPGPASLGGLRPTPLYFGPQLRGRIALSKTQLIPSSQNRFQQRLSQCPANPADGRCCLRQPSFKTMPLRRPRLLRERTKEVRFQNTRGPSHGNEC